ncbi:MAG: Asp-tRNA(Asn)/Glu-tRNA(Gln) amidotransferase subunit GatC [Phycisphaera sp.]|nr:Asp-tRNA(Asn)/Glu-tRNA(Gln) amidotransferase subunit GatC [Phycisphaera sp.]
MSEQPPNEPITAEQVKHVAKLARLALSPDQVEHHARKLANVLGYAEKIGQLNVEGVEPMAHAMDLSNVMREDKVNEGLSVDKVLANAPDKEPPFFKVVKVLGEGAGA